MRIRAFQGLRPNPDVASEVASLPYDVVSTDEARALASDNPKSFLHVVRAEIDLPEDTNPYTQPVYDQAKANLEKLQSENWLQRETAPSLYVYEQEMNGHKQKGLVCVCHIEDYENNIIKKHEKTRQQKEDDRTNLNRTLRAHPGPVFLTYREQAAIDAKIEEAAQKAPIFEFTAPDGVKHTVWRIEGDVGLVEDFAQIPVSYVADGHHRSASAARVGKELRDANPNHTGEENYNWFLSVLFPQDQLNVLAYNRAVVDLNGASADELLEKIKTVCNVTENADPTPDAVGKAAMYLNGAWYGLEFDSSGDTDPISKLDVSKLQNKILEPFLGVDDPRTSDRIDFIGGIRGIGELEERVNSGKFAVAFSMYPVTVDQLMDIADADQIMPPKSTWFEPKLRSGLFVHTF